MNELPNAIAIDIDMEQGMIYWTDTTHDSVQRAKIGANNNTFEIVIQFNLESPEGIAIDWIGRKVYWTDRTPGKIEVSELDGRNRAVLVNENIKTPRAIAVHPRYRYYWMFVQVFNNYDNHSIYCYINNIASRVQLTNL